MKSAQLLAIYKDSIIADAGKQSITNGTTFDTVRTVALKKVRTAVLEEVRGILSARIHGGTVADDALREAVELIERLRDEP